LVLNFGLWTLVFGSARSFKGQRPKTKYQLSPFQQINLVYPDRFLVAIERNDNAEADCRLSSSDDDYKYSEHLTGVGIYAPGFLQVSGKGNEVQIGRIQDQLNRHEDNDDISARENSSNTDDKKQRPNDEKLREVRASYTLNHLRNTTIACFLEKQNGK